ncbi:Chromatin assembly factor 1 subunit A family protein [Babesia bovis T2Bo]|uniref:Chromatin assembly factor 1 subunit A dimerization domain-containing protein n=1 Tax=Babesia bovis TaxID=5865 RepID=A7AU90_BABBO|nr:Chromatin assembly factor 1 subunit A family protein [Babesia bovis T2Bo]EDO06501.1 Chromatin assembly factor 1 subunit A family protein [Babesia bovis T2Bo]|eukprot:XP_001610069.1 hypothetical protein [Babesia bovis T2Bo]
MGDVNTDSSGSKVQLSEEDQQSLCDTESEISQLLSCGISDTSIIGNDDDCNTVWQYVKDRDSVDELGIDNRLKAFVRAFAEGSSLNISSLLTRLRTQMAKYSEFLNIDSKLDEMVPLMLMRKNLGEPFAGSVASERLESNKPECLWVWESPDLDVFPPVLRDRVMAARESRNLVSRRYRTLVALKNALLEGNAIDRMSANEQLGIIYKKMLLEKERQERLASKRKVSETKPTISTLFNKQPHVRDSRSSKATSGDKAVSRSGAKPSPVAKNKSPNMLLKWLKPSPSTGGDTSATTHVLSSKSVEATSPVERSSDPCTIYAVPSMEDLDDMGATSDQMSQIKELITSAPHVRRAGIDIIGDNTDDALPHSGDTTPVDTVTTEDTTPTSATRTTRSRSISASSPKHEDATATKYPRFNDFKRLCESHREAWKRYFTYVDTNRRFYVDASTQAVQPTSEEGALVESTATPERISRTFIVDDVVNNVKDTIYGDPALRVSRGIRVFHMSDNEWKRPSMRLVITRESPLVNPLSPLSIEPAMDYFLDSDEEWFEQYDVDDVDESGSEEEEDDDEEHDWIVQDNPQQGPQKHTQNLCEVVKVFCMNRNWHWIVDGVPQNVEYCSSIEEARKNGMSIVPSDYGFGYEGYTQNPISEFITNMRGHNIIMTKEDVQEFLKSCHATHTKKETLIADFKEKRPHCSIAEIREKFKKYICRMKVDSTPQRWLVTTEAAILFGIRDELDSILATAMEQVAEVD